MDLSELETISSQLLENQKRLRQIEAEIDRLKVDLREKPRRSEKDRKFYALIGFEWDEPKLEERMRGLSDDRQGVAKEVDDAKRKIVSAFSAGMITVPLDPTPLITGERTSFKYRSNAVYPNAIAELSELLGLLSPIGVDEVRIGPEGVTVEETDPYNAKLKVVEAFDKIRKTIALKLQPARRTRF